MILLKQRHSLVFSLVFFVHFAWSQVEGTMPFMKSLPQATYYNPAFKSEYRFSVGLPGSSVFYQYANNGFTYNDFISKQNGILTADMSKLYASLKDNNYLNNNWQAEMLRFSLKANARLYLTFNVTAKVYTRIMLPKELVGIFANGTEAYVNNTAALSPEAEALGYAEIGLGAAYTVNRKLTVGVKLKLLKGAMNATTQKALFNLSLSDTYAITARGDADIRTSGIHNLDQDGYDLGKNWRDYTNNTGFAFDLGATYRVIDRLTLGVSLLDIGGITWQNDLYGYKLDPNKASYTFVGIDARKLLNGNSDYTKSLSDSLEVKFKFTEARINSYYTALPTKIYATGVYELKKNLTVGALLSAESFRGRFMTGFTASLNKEVGRRVGASLSYTVSNRSFNNLGAGLSLNFAPLQIYFVADNILTAPFSYLADGNYNSFVNSTQYFNFRTGINFIFGREKVQEKHTYPKNSKSK
ncbi:MAG: DUF5723 family protein [Cyclobacteriaceae bacterium]|nr:DUF5723 family protein [Cyclobacteriaceae bacterium]